MLRKTKDIAGIVSGIIIAVAAPTVLSIPALAALIFADALI